MSFHHFQMGDTKNTLYALWHHKYEFCYLKLLVIGHSHRIVMHTAAMPMPHA